MPSLLPLGVQIFIGFALIGYAIISYLNQPDLGDPTTITQKQAQFSDPGLGTGPWTNQSTSATPIPVVFGYCRVPLNMVHFRLEGDDYKDEWLVYALSEDWSTLAPYLYGSAKQPHRTVIPGFVDPNTGVWSSGIWIQDRTIDSYGGYTGAWRLNAAQAGNYYAKTPQGHLLPLQGNWGNREQTWWQWFESGVGISWSWITNGKFVWTTGLGLGTTWSSSNIYVNGGEVLHIRSIISWVSPGTEFSPYYWTNEYYWVWEKKTTILGNRGKGKRTGKTRIAPGPKGEPSPAQGRWYEYVRSVQVAATPPGGTTVGVTITVRMVSGPQINRVIANWYMGEYFNNVQTQTNYADPGSKSPDPYTAYYSYSGSEDRAWDCQVPWGWVGDLQVVATLHTLTNEGRFTMDSVVVSNGTWQYETVNTYGTSLLLVRIHDTDRTLSRPMAQVMVSGGPANPAMALYWLLKNKELGLGVSDDYIDELSFMEAAAKLDQVGYRFDRAYCSDSLIQQVITDICMAGRLVYCEIAGRHAIYFDEETPVEYVRVVDLENYASNIQFGEKSLFDTPNRFVIKYVDIHNDYTLQDMIYDDVNLQQEIGCVNEFTINLAGTANADHAWQLGWYYAMYANHTKTLSFTLKPILWDLTPGTIFRSTSQFNPYLNNREWVVQSIEESELYTYVVSCIEYPRTAYHVSSTYVPDDPYVVNDPPPPPTDPGAITATAYIHFTDFVTPTLVDNYHVRVNLTIEYVSDEVKQLKLYKKADADTSFTLLTTFPQGTTEFKYTYVEDNIWQTVEWRATGIDSEGTESPLDLATRFQYYLAGNPEAPLGWGEGLYGLIPYDLSQPIESEPVIEPEPDPLQQGGVGV